MSKHEPAIALVDPDLPEPERAMAMRYVLSRLDADWDTQRDVSVEATARYLLVRYGLTPEEVEVDAYRSRGALLAAVRAAYCKHREPVLVESFGSVYETPWDEEQACVWLAHRLEARWPQQVTPFVATDLETLWTANRAIDWARPNSIAKGPFRDLPVLIQGPTGTGKELLAEAIHTLSSTDSAGTFGALNCGGLSADLLESELFGHKKGAFTGAIQDKGGFIEQHHTLFLDEIGDAPLEIQIRLLRFLNTGEYRAVGATKSQVTNRSLVVSATHRNLLKLVESGDFREDLFYRLTGRVLRLQPIARRGPRARRELVEAMFKAAATRAGVAKPDLSKRAQHALELYPFPGNMRELKHVVESIVAHREERRFDLDDLPDEVHRYYRVEVDRSYRIAWELESKIEGASDEEARLATLYSLQRPQHGDSEKVVGLKRGRMLLARLAKLLGAEPQLQPYLELLDLQVGVQERQDHLEILDQIDSPLPEMQSLRERFKAEIVRQQEDLVESETRAKDADARHAIALVGRVALELSQLLPRDILSDLDRFVSTLEAPLVSAWVKKYGSALRNLTPGDVRSHLALDAGDSPEAPTLNDLNDPETLRSLLEEMGSASALAREVGCSDKVVRTRAKKAGITLAPGARRKKIVATSDRTK